MTANQSLSARSDGGALREALQKIVGMAAKRRTDHAECHCTVCEMRDVAEAALATSPARDAAEDGGRTLCCLWKKA